MSLHIWIFDPIEYFMKIVDSGVQICVFSDEVSVARIKEVIVGYKNVTIMEPINIDQLWVHSICEKYLKVCKRRLPITRIWFYIIPTQNSCA